MLRSFRVASATKAVHMASGTRNVMLFRFTRPLRLMRSLYHGMLTTSRGYGHEKRGSGHTKLWPHAPKRHPGDSTAAFFLLSEPWLAGWAADSTTRSPSPRPLRKSSSAMAAGGRPSVRAADSRPSKVSLVTAKTMRMAFPPFRAPGHGGSPVALRPPLRHRTVEPTVR